MPGSKLQQVALLQVLFWRCSPKQTRFNAWEYNSHAKGQGSVQSVLHKHRVYHRSPLVGRQVIIASGVLYGIPICCCKASFLNSSISRVTNHIIVNETYYWVCFRSERSEG